ncbi:MAG: asparaginase domain-containing protein [Nanoarchaeota archaeon]
MSKPKVLLIKTGGTVSQKPNRKGEMVPYKRDYMHLVGGLEQLADLDVINAGNLDSTDMETVRPADSKKKAREDIAKIIYKNSSGYDGFVVVHGTDTMAETAAALTYMIQGLGKPIIMTGAQRSIWTPRSDAPNNIYGAVQAATKNVGEVAVCFGNYLLRGTRVVKTDEEGFDAFSTPGISPIGKMTALKEGIRLESNRITRMDGDPHLFTDFENKIFHYVHVSGADVGKDLMNIARSSNNKAIILGSFGAGNLPSKLLDFIKASGDNGKPVYVYTNCQTGAADMGIYSVGAAPLKVGARPAGDMTLEALGQKMMYALGRANQEKLIGDDRIKFVESIIKRPYNGDIMVTERRT